jgi:hypothetical protein
MEKELKKIIKRRDNSYAKYTRKILEALSDIVDVLNVEFKKHHPQQENIELSWEDVILYNDIILFTVGINYKIGSVLTAPNGLPVEITQHNYHLFNGTLVNISVPIQLINKPVKEIKQFLSKGPVQSSDQFDLTSLTSDQKKALD